MLCDYKDEYLVSFAKDEKDAFLQTIKVEGNGIKGILPRFSIEYEPSCIKIIEKHFVLVGTYSMQIEILKIDDDGRLVQRSSISTCELT